VVGCTSPLVNCGGTCTNTQSDIANCGGCNIQCPAGPNASPTCVSGSCGFACLTGWSNCDTSSTNGCEANLNTSLQHCGACGRACSNSQVLSLACSNGKCSSTCVLGFGNCEQPTAPQADDGCELPTTSNLNNCGGCKSDCASQQLGMCSNNTCGCIDKGECGGDGADCVAGPQGSVCQCSGNPCAAGERCSGLSGACSCNGGLSCSTIGATCCPGTGCKFLSSDALNCGACGRTCPPGFVCQGSVCRCSGSPSCNAGFAGTCVNGACDCGILSCALGKRCIGSNVCG
jgi:hypothetical protein